MTTIREISKTLAQASSLMQGKLSWDSWSELITFMTPGGMIQARPVLIPSLTPERIARFISKKDKDCMLIVPYLSGTMMDRLDHEENIMIADLCGNGLIKSPPLYIRLSGNPNLYPDFRPAGRPYEKNSAQAAIILLEEQIWKDQTEILKRIAKRGGSMTKGQLSKLVSRYENDGALRRQGSTKIIVSSPEILLDGLLKARRSPQPEQEEYYRFSQDVEWGQVQKKAIEQGIKWCLSPQYSLQKYAFSGEGTPMSLWTDSPEFFRNMIELETSPVPAFAHLSVIETESPTAFFQTVRSGNTIWSGPVATWLAFASGDARQKNMASPLYKELIDFHCKQLINSIEK